MERTKKHNVPSAEEETLPVYKQQDLHSLDDSKETQIYSPPTYFTDTGITGIDEATLQPGTRLQIHARGHKLSGLPLPSSQLKIAITDSSGNPVYYSKREKRTSDEAILSHVKLGDILSTSYFLGPNRNPVMKILKPGVIGLDTINVKTYWSTRATSFTLPNGRTFEWFYNNSKSSKSEHLSVLVLRQVDGDSVKLKKKDKAKSQVVAKLIRSDETRTKGTTRWTAGNGGELVFDADAANHLEESIVVATCLMMLKKEVNRRRGWQCGGMVVGAAGGSPPGLLPGT